MASHESPTAGDAAVAQNLDDAAHGQGMGLPHSGGEAVEVEAGGVGEGNHPDPSVFGLDATVWVSIAMAAFILVLLFKRVPAAIGGMLDRQIAGIRQRLDEAKAIRAEAETLRAEYARRLASVEADAKAMVTQAEEEARQIVAKAEADAADLTQRRARMAEDKIAAAERTALAQVRARAADAATAVAAQIIAERHGTEADRPLVDRTIAGLGRPN